MADKINALRKTPIFSELSEDTLASLALAAKVVERNAGEEVFSEGDPGNSVYIIRSGEVRIWMEGRTGTDITLATLEAPDAFGTLALLDERPRSATAVAVTDAQMLVLYRKDFLAVLEHEFAAVKTVLRALAGMIRQTNEKVSEIATLGLARRVNKAIAFFIDRYGTTLDAGAVRIEHPMTKEELASQAGLYVNEVERVLRDLQWDNVIEREPETWLVRRPEHFATSDD